ncbi:P-II family nitrogen regulator [Pseudomonas stutzeri]|uniref:P-II family nitrogen regulator n=1 Tax=Stutzerimonas stutzeri TaxID=316 RepID=UPI00190DBA4D|nr:P-II family nitrogen regulator [Stutzerimonas stutzeri]MBK3868715.1 P-II family nitrogen regulator [Stutzerimonas stutzeri]
MKQVTAIFRPIRLEAVEQALHVLPHLPGFTILPAHGHPRGHGQDHSYIADEWNPDAHQHLVLIAFCSDEVADEVVQAIEKAAHTGVTGDGIVAVAPLTDVLRIRTGERGDAAL